MWNEEQVKAELKRMSEHHKKLCSLNPPRGSMFDKASYIALGRIGALEDVLKGEKNV